MTSKLISKIKTNKEKESEQRFGKKKHRITEEKLKDATEEIKEYENDNRRKSGN